MRFIGRTPARTFILYPIITLIWEYIINRGSLRFHPLFLPLMIWGYLQYRLCGFYRIKHGGGGPGLETPPERLVTSGPYAYTRNPMYLGHVVFLTGLALTLQSWFAAALTIGIAGWFHARVIGDERKLADHFGQPYIVYTKSVKRWIPGLF
ncbi:MAG TPA: isoprenylcysteine carboxylmethyltransferase family protein [Candidatus Udaeobacter sp.]|nr:isoprenylcysteine carboxylmethyltransferase family protein [Candidatus Udaeobacter sp.]